MFEVPDAKRVRREDLYSPPASPRSSPDPELADALRASLNQRFEIDVKRHVAAPATADADADSDEELDFRLFAAPTATTTNAGPDTAPGPKPLAQKIRVRSPSLDPAEAGFLAPRPQTHYFTPGTGALPAAELAAAALSGKQVLQLSRAAWPGCVVPWKVVRVDAAGRELRRRVEGHACVVGEGGGGVAGEEGQGKKKRKGKKARIALRVKVRAREEKKAVEERMKREREEAEREKRTRRNREKKVKKRVRDKAKRVAGMEGEEAGSEKGGEGEGEDVSMAEA
ncbi:uncharacterized protein K452DRAFT_283456 [Aplosporella prunicola CBS 121167]|uniref:Uncharacterized protein n=1 Tax=Aplosporella prunicola CBS 121167 TaxID=1176127 RepID=A0A6A6BSF6_9PEZI|nr:uncharacterized protein K452DRAFT_283456 [Aplosporella prunicola CBS 121167]KAF2146164.1 hypothetical protein K452DRAFT_283456 [Aplosporella prunicola CBS 121167]